MRSLVLLAALALFAACGDEEEKEGNEVDMCRHELAAFEACGGDVVGTWNVETFCTESDLNFAPDDPACQDTRMDVSGTTVTGTYTFNADGSFHSSTSTQLNASMTLSDACLLALAPGSSVKPETVCDLADEAPLEGFQLSCSYGRSCVCTMKGTLASEDDGAYEVRAHAIVRTDLPGHEGMPFCVDGDRLLVQSSASTGDSELTTLQIFRRK